MRHIWSSGAIYKYPHLTKQLPITSSQSFCAPLAPESMLPRDGSILFGYCLDILLYGILTVQLYIYYLSFPNDRCMTKATVAFVYAVGTLQTAFALRDFYIFFCKPQPYEVLPDLFYRLDLREFGFMWITIPLSGASVAAVSQLFYAHRIYILSGKKMIPGVVIVLALLQLTVGILIAFTRYKTLPTFVNFLYVSSSILDSLAWELSGAICDLVITIYMFRFLSRHTQRSFKPTRVSLTKIKRLTLESGLLTTSVALAYVLTFIVAHNAFIIPGLALSKVYGNSILALLNSRLRIPGGRNEIDSDCVVNHLTITGRQTEQPQDDPLRPSTAIPA